MGHIALLTHSASTTALSANDWAAQILAAWSKQVTAIVETGWLLTGAKEHLSHGEWLPMIKKQLPFSAATAEQLIAIARHPILANPDHAQNLPPSWTTLYRLSRLSEREVEAGIASGAIHAGMQRKDAMALRGLASAAPAGTAPSGKNASQSTTHRTSADYLEAFEELISRAVKNLPTAQHAQLFVGLRLIVFHWEGAAEENAAPSASEQPAKMLH